MAEPPWELLVGIQSSGQGQEVRFGRERTENLVVKVVMMNEMERLLLQERVASGGGEEQVLGQKLDEIQLSQAWLGYLYLVLPTWLSPQLDLSHW